MLPQQVKDLLQKIFFQLNHKGNNMNVSQGDLVIIGLHTNTPQVVWKGQTLTNVTAIRAVNDELTKTLSITISEDPLVAELKAAGIIVKRV